MTLGVALMFAYSAVQKGRDIPRFESYLRPLAGGYRVTVARGVVVLEFVLSMLPVVSTVASAVRTVDATCAVAFIFFATLAYSALLGTGASSECHCFSANPLTASRRTGLEGRRDPIRQTGGGRWRRDRRDD